MENKNLIFQKFETLSENAEGQLVSGFSMAYDAALMGGLTDPVTNNGCPTNNCSGGNCVSGCGTSFPEEP